MMDLYSAEPLKKVSRVRRSHLDEVTARTLFPQACTSSSTILSAYYPLGSRSKHDETNFNEWNSRFFSLNDNMIIVTDTSGEERITSAREQSEGCTLVILDELNNAELFKMTDWKLQHDKDPEAAIHSNELYIVWNQKILWLEMSVEHNPFQSAYFFWADSGQFRDSRFLKSYIAPKEKWITAPGNIPGCKVIFLSIEKFEPHELVQSTSGMTPPLNSTLVRLGGGNFGGDACSILSFAPLFRETMLRYLELNRFIGKDQPLYSSTCASWPSVCFLIDAQKVSEIDDPWFALQPVLHGTTWPIPEYKLS